MRIHNFSDRRSYAPITAEPAGTKTESKEYTFADTRELVQLVHDAADLIHSKGEAAFNDFRIPGSKWQNGEKYIFVLSAEGVMLVHPDSEMAGKNQLDLKDIDGKPIIRGLIEVVTRSHEKDNGWYHYHWPVRGGLLPRWKSSYVQLVAAPTGERYIVGSGIYNDRMEREFVVDLVTDAVVELEKDSEEAIRTFHDPTGPFLAKDAYIFVIDMNGVELVNPAFPSLEGSNFLDYKDSMGNYPNREIVRVAQTYGSGWVNYMWPKPGESVATQKSAFVQKAYINGKPVAVGCGVYLADAPKERKPVTPKMKPQDLIVLVREAANMLEDQGEEAYPEFRVKGSKWFHDDTYVFVSSMDGVRVFHAALPETEGTNLLEEKDVAGKPIVKMMLELAKNANGEGWVHYQYRQPGSIFPAWKSAFVRQVRFPSGQKYMVGSGIYNMEMNKTFVEDVVNRAVDLINQRGKEAFPLLRDKKGPFVFMDIYVFVENPDGMELVNGAFPSLEGMNLKNLKDVDGKTVVSDQIAAALGDESAWLECNWYRPGTNTPALKQVYVRKAQFGKETFIVGSGIYSEEGFAATTPDIQKFSWQSLKAETLTEKLQLQRVYGEKGTLARYVGKRGTEVARHYHENEEYNYVVSGALKYRFDDREVVINAGEVIVVPPNVPHAPVIMEDSTFVIFFAPRREDWLRGEDQYLRK